MNLEEFLFVFYHQIFYFIQKGMIGFGFGSQEIEDEEFQYWEESRARQKWRHLKERLELKQQIQSWKLPRKRTQSGEISSSQMHKSPLNDEDFTVRMSLKGVSAGKRSGKRKKPQEQSVQSGKRSKFQRKCLNCSSQSMSFNSGLKNIQKKEKKMFVLSAPKSYNLPTLNQTKLLQIQKKEEDQPQKLFSPKNMNTKFTYFRHSQQRKNKYKQWSNKKVGEDLGTGREDGNGVGGGLLGVLGKLKNSYTMKKDSENIENNLTNCLILSRNQSPKKPQYI